MEGKPFKPNNKIIQLIFVCLILIKINIFILKIFLEKIIFLKNFYQQIKIFKLNIIILKKCSKKWLYEIKIMKKKLKQVYFISVQFQKK